MGLRRNQNFLDYMGFRQSELENRIQECLRAIEKGETCIRVDCSDMTSEEQEFFQKELQRRINNL